VRNNFDLIRLILASTIFTYHLAVVTGRPELSMLAIAPAGFAVDAFFVVSGYLVWMSFDRATSLGDYASKRLRRVLPAHTVVVIATALVAAALSGAFVQVLWSRNAAEFLTMHLIMLSRFHSELEGTFPTAIWMQANGTLWSLKVEMGCYALLPLLAWMARRFGWIRVMGLTYGFSVVWLATAPAPYEHQTPGLLSYFIAGGTLYHYRDWLSTRWKVIGPIGAAALLLGFAWPVLRPVVEPAALATLVIAMAVAVPPLVNAARWGDLSYGVFLVHWPILQCLLQVEAFNSPWQGVALAIVCVFGTSLLLWHLVEKRWLRRSSHYITVAAP